MTCGNIVCSYLFCTRQKRLPLNISIACYTWIRRSSVFIFIYKILYYTIFKISAEVQYIMRYAYAVCNPSCVIYSRKSAATAVIGYILPVFFLPYLHCNADNVIPLFFQQICRNGAVNSARHTYNYFTFIHYSSGIS